VLSRQHFRIFIFIRVFPVYILHTHTHIHGKKRSVFNLKGKLFNFAEIEFLSSFFPFSDTFSETNAYRSSQIWHFEVGRFYRHPETFLARIRTLDHNSFLRFYLTFTDRARAIDERIAYVVSRTCVFCLTVVSFSSISEHVSKTGASGASISPLTILIVGDHTTHAYACGAHMSFYPEDTHAYHTRAYVLCYLTRCYDVHYSMFFFTEFA